MRGFQPGKARAVPQNYADGGVVSTIKGMLGFGGGKKKPEPLPADLNKMPPTGAGPVASQPEPPKKAISQYSGMSALERRMKEQGLADGGLVRGPGTGISDDIEDEVPEGTFIMPADSTEAVGPETMDQLGQAEVPVNLSNGEAKLPPEALQAIGAQVMEAIKDVTHVPAAQQARGFSPAGMDADDNRMNFADGGVVDDKRRPRTVADMARSPGYGAGAGGPVGTTVRPQAQPSPARPQINQPAQGVMRQGSSAQAAPAQPSTSGLPLGSGVYQLDRDVPSPPSIQAQARPAPAPSQAATTYAPPRRDRGMPAPDEARGSMLGEFFRDSVSEISDKARDGDLAGAFGAATRRTLQAPGMTVAAAATPALEAAGRMWDGLVGNESAPAIPAAAPAAATKPPATTVAPAAQAGSSQSQVKTPNPNPNPNPSPSPNPQQGTTPPAVTPPSNEVMPGVFRLGNSFGDSPAAAAAGARPSQGPSARSMEAMNNLIARDPTAGAMDRALGVERDPARASTGFPQGGARPAAPSTSVKAATGSAGAPASARGFQPSGQPTNLMESYARQSEALRGLADAQRALDDYGPRMSGGGDLLKGGRSSQQQFQQDMLRTNLMTQAANGGRGGAAAMQALNGMEGNQIQRETAQMREQGDTARFNAREAGETTRAGMRGQAEARRDGITAELGRGQLDLQRSAQGFTTRQGERQEKLYAEYEAAKTPEEQAAVARKIAALSGKEQPADWKVQVTPQTKNVDGSTTEGSVIRYNSRTGDVQRVDGGQAALPPGMVKMVGTSNGKPVYEDAQGKRHMAG